MSWINPNKKEVESDQQVPVDFPSPEQQPQPQQNSKFAMDYNIVFYRSKIRRLQWLEKHIKLKKQIPEWLADGKSPKPMYMVLDEAEQLKTEIEEIEDFLAENGVEEKDMAQIKQGALAEESGYTKVTVK